MKIPSDLAQQLLETDFANLCGKLSAGGNLTTSERKMLEGNLTTGAKATPISASPATPNLEQLASTPEALPNGEASAGQIALWEEIYDTKRRQLYRYIATGRELGIPCPLDSPAAMPDWWAKCMKQKIKPKILEAAQAAARQSTASTPPSSPPRPSTPAESLAPLPDFDLPNAPTYDFPAQVARLRTEHQRIQDQLDAARRGTIVDGFRVVSQADCESLLRQSLTLTAELRKSESDLLAWLNTRGQLSETAIVRAENSRIAGVIHGAVRRLVKVVRPMLNGKTDPEQDSLWDIKVRECFSALKAARFTDSLPA
jgi:hypothetical protein